MAVAFDTAVQVSGNGVNSLALPSITTATNNEVIIVSVHNSNTDVPSIPTATGLTFARIGANLAITGGNGNMGVFWALAAVAQAYSISVTTGSGFPQCTALATAFSGNRITFPVGAFGSNASASTGTPSQVITTTANNSLVTGYIGETGSNAITAGASQTIAVQTTAGPPVSLGASLYQNAVTAASGTAVTMNATFTASPMGMFAVEILAPRNLGFITNNLRPHAFSPGLAR